MYYSFFLSLGFIADLLLGDPSKIPHPVSFIGRLISFLENFYFHKIRKNSSNNLLDFLSGAVVCLIVCSLSFFIPFIILFFAFKISFWLWAIINVIFCWQALAIKSLKDAVNEVLKALECGDIVLARQKLSMVVGRDTQNLNEAEIIKASIETVSENTSDGVIAPMFYFMIGGAPLAFLYKAINTLDSMIGYKTEKYRFFGKFAARLDDVANFIPARLTGLLYIVASFFLGYDYKNAFKIFKRDRFNHSSPNSAHPESACAGALDIMLGGPAYYFGRYTDKKTIGDELKKPETGDIKKTFKLLYSVSIIGLITLISLSCLIRLF